MTNNEEQQLLNDQEKKLWNAADKLRSIFGAAQGYRRRSFFNWCKSLFLLSEG